MALDEKSRVPENQSKENIPIGFFEVIALPDHKKVVVEPVKLKTIAGEKTKFIGRKDRDGFYHWVLPEAYAQHLCFDTCGMNHAFVGPTDTDYMEFRTRVGIKMTDVKIPRHIRMVHNGEVTYKPFDTKEYSMATISDVIARQPAIFTKRYGNDRYISWINELLEELSGKGWLPGRNYEKGVLVNNGEWIDKPAGYREAIRVYCPNNSDLNYQITEVNNRIKLVRDRLDAETSPPTLSVFSAQTTVSVAVDLTGYAQDALADFLLVITAGTLAGQTFVISGNDISGVTSTVLYLLHPLSTAFAIADVTAAKLIDPDHYLMLEYMGSYTPATSVDDEVPIDDEFQIRITNVYLRYCAEKEAQATSSETEWWQTEYYRILNDIAGERLAGPMKPITGRRLPGFVYKYRNRTAAFNNDQHNNK